MISIREIDLTPHPSAESLPPASEDLDRVLDQLERSLQVDLIATYDLTTCLASDRCSEVLDWPEHADFDQFPVKEDGRVIGVLERDNHQCQDRSVRDVMRGLDETMLIAASTAILSYIGLATESPYHLVVKQNRICGIVTPSDLLGLPVRILLFTVITHLESTMTSLIRRRFPDDSWLENLSHERKKRLNKRFEALRTERREPDRLKLTQLYDKRVILAEGVLTSDERDDFERDLETLEKLRNNVMHSSDYEKNAHTLSELVDKAEHWIQELSAR